MTFGFSLNTDANVMSELDSFATRRLALVRQVYNRAVAHSGRYSSRVDRLLCVIELDLSVETLLKTIFRVRDQKSSYPKGFDQLVSKVDSLLQQAGEHGLTEKAKARRVRKIRNDAQHEARYPSEMDVAECRVDTRDFLKSAVANSWNTDFDSISAADIIDDERLKDQVRDAEEALKSEDFPRVVLVAMRALHDALLSAQSTTVGERWVFDAPYLVDSNGDQSTISGMDNLIDTLRQMHLTLLYLTIGMDYRAYSACRQIEHRVGVVEGEPDVVGDDPVSRDEAEFVLNHCTDTISQIEDTLGDIRSPKWPDY